MTFSPSQLQSSDFRFCIQKVRHGWILMWKPSSFGPTVFLEHCLVEEGLKSKCCRFSNLHWGILTQHLSMQPSPLQLRWNSGHSCMDFLGGVNMLLINNAHIPEMNLPVPHHGNSKLQEWKTQPTQRLGCTKALWSSMQQRNQWNCELVSRKSQHRNPSITVCSHQRPPLWCYSSFHLCLFVFRTNKGHNFLVWCDTDKPKLLKAYNGIWSKLLRGSGNTVPVKQKGLQS